MYYLHNATMEESTTYYDNLIARYLSGEATPEQIQEISDWLVTGPENLAHFEQLHKVWLLSTRDAIDQNVNLTKEWNQIATRIKTEVPVKQMPARKPGQKMLIWAAAAAAILLLTAIPGIYFFLNNQTTSISATTSGLIYDLPDGSKITLKKGAAIEFDKEFGTGNRNIEMTGEAYFEVKHMSEIPFTISGGEARIQVLGTQFNVRALPNEDQVTVVLTSGSVSLWFDANNKKSTILKPGEKAEMNLREKKIEAGVNPDVNYMAWKTRQLRFENSSLNEVMQAISAVYEINYQPLSQSLSACRLTASFDNMQLQEVLDVVGSTLDLQFTLDNNTIKISGQGCN